MGCVGSHESNDAPAPYSYQDRAQIAMRSTNSCDLRDEGPTTVQGNVVTAVLQDYRNGNSNGVDPYSVRGRALLKAAQSAENHQQRNERQQEYPEDDYRLVAILYKELEHLLDTTFDIKKENNENRGLGKQCIQYSTKKFALWILLMRKKRP